MYHDGFEVRPYTLAVGEGAPGNRPKLEGKTNSNHLVRQQATTPQDYWSFTLNSRIPSAQQILSLGPSDVTRTMRSIDNEITAIEHALYEARTRRNLLSLPCRLPPELLSMCFLFLCVMRPPKIVKWDDDRRTSKIVNNFGWMKVSRVCGHFREVAMAEPRLWTDIAFSSMGRFWASKALSLAKMAPLTVRATPVDPYHMDTILSTIRTKMSHIKTIILHSDLLEHFELYMEFMRSVADIRTPAPLLETLEMGLPRQVKTALISLPDNVFNLQAPSLRRLVLQGFQVPPSAFSLLKSVVNLSIRYPWQYLDDMAPAEQSSFVQNFCSLLRSAFHVEHLNLEDCFPSLPSDSAHITSLPNLRVLDLSGTIVGCHTALSCLDIPSSARLHVISTYTYHDTPEDIYSLLLAIARHTRQTHAPRIRMLTHRCGVSSKYAYELRAWDVCRPSVTHDPKTAGSEEPVFSLFMERDVPDLRPALSLFDVSELHALEIEHEARVAFVDWRSILTTTVSLEAITVHDLDSVVTFCKALVQSSESDCSQADSDIDAWNRNIILPNLTSVTIVAVLFDVYEEGNRPGKLDEMSPLWLLGILSQRKALGYPIQRLHITGYKGREVESLKRRGNEWLESWLEKLEQVVEKVTVTGYERGAMSSIDASG